MQKNSNRNQIPAASIISILIAAILILGTIWTGYMARRDTEQAVSSVSLLYLDELAGRREEVVSSALRRNITNLKTAVGLITEEDLRDIQHLQKY